MSEIEQSLPPQAPESPRRITEISFTSFAGRLEKLEQSETKNEPKERGKIFWLRITREMTKIQEMQNVFKYLRYAQAGPAIKKIRTKEFFNKWKKAISAHKWIVVAYKLQDQIRLNEFKENAYRIVRVRSKFTKEKYVKTHEFTPDFTFLSNLVTINTVQPIKQLIPTEPLPQKDEYEYEEIEYEEEEEEASQEQIPFDQVKSPKSHQQNQLISTQSTNVNQSGRSKVSERDVIIEEDENVNNENTDENIDENTDENIDENLTTSTAEKKKSSKLWIILGVLLIVGALIAAFVFLGKSQSGEVKSIDNVDEVVQNDVGSQETPVAESTPEATSETLATSETVTTENATTETKEL